MLPDSQPIGVDQCNCFNVRKAARQITRLYDACLQPSGLRLTQFLTLATLNEQQGVSVNGLAERLDIERTAMGKMIGFLERDGFVQVEPSPTDGRTRVVELTSEGMALFERAAPLWLEAQQRFTELNGEANVRALRRSLSTMKVESTAPSSPE
jgi:DNA-binding MarR family transcriptional regulator